MPKIVSSQKRRSDQTWKKFTLSSLVVISFAAYAIRARLMGVDESSVLTPTSSGAANASASVSTLSSAPRTQVVAAPQVQPTATANGRYRDGQYTGDVVDAYYGNVQVEAVIQSGSIQDVQFLDYPHDRRTSQRINAQAMPWLTTEAVQAQSANVDIISGATLTSQAFALSLQSALKQART
ncbi:MAG: FMN-binding protein [Chloroflexota bacterium]